MLPDQTDYVIFNYDEALPADYRLSIRAIRGTAKLYCQVSTNYLFSTVYSNAVTESVLDFSLVMDANSSKICGITGTGTDEVLLETKMYMQAIETKLLSSNMQIYLIAGSLGLLAFVIAVSLILKCRKRRKVKKEVNPNHISDISIMLRFSISFHRKLYLKAN